MNVLGPEQRGEMSVHQNLDKPKEPVESVMELEETAKQLKNTLGTEQPEGPVDKKKRERLVEKFEVYTKKRLKKPTAAVLFSNIF